MSLKQKLKKWWNSARKSIHDFFNPPDPSPTPPAPPEPDPDPKPTPEPVPPNPDPGHFPNPKLSGFLWKPIGANSKRLRVLLPPEWKRNLFEYKRVEIWNRFSHLETLSPTGPGNPIPGRGEREHFSGAKQGSQYPAGCVVRAHTLAGESWQWTIKSPGARNENISCDLFKSEMGNPLCPHGKPWAECNACMVEGDLQFDAARERAFFGPS